MFREKLIEKIDFDDSTTYSPKKCTFSFADSRVGSAREQHKAETRATVTEWLACRQIKQWQMQIHY